MTRSEWWMLFKLGGAVILLAFALGSVAYGLGWIGEGAGVVQDEFGAKAALEKYEWFIDRAEAIKKADADIALYEQRRLDIENQYVTTYGADHTKWPTSVQVQYNQAASTARDDLLAIVSNRNGLAAEYNAQAEKFNWAPFLTRPDMPPRYFVEYVVK